MNKPFLYIILIYLTSVTLWGEPTTLNIESSVSPLLKVEAKTNEKQLPIIEVKNPETQMPSTQRRKVQKISTHIMEHKVLRRLVVFPFKIDRSYKAAAEDAW